MNIVIAIAIIFIASPFIVFGVIKHRQKKDWQHNARKGECYKAYLERVYIRWV